MASVPDDADLEDETPAIKMVVVGDGAIGKTCLLMRYTKGTFPSDGYVPTVFDNMTKETTLHHGGQDQTVQLDLWDTAGQEEFDRIRPLSYRDADVFLLCFSVTSPASFENVQLKWLPELQHHEKSALILLVGLKSDLRGDGNVLQKLDDLNQSPITHDDAAAYAKSINAAAFIECSALNNQANPSTKCQLVSDVFDTAITAFLGDPNDESPPTSSCCVIL